ncbi:methyltransferase [Ruicaihuangia caeni]|uniref:Methyltransferase n=1 Tax=Ruicaihuangia caeni TaxID=3042517 RepID=A0AAW6T3W7_9MICO|nr:methyltransferase [Klugiella sp. YN-L-19]MDI2097771.1 methyltransferase [Klugiella sp. YN-L-19]
MNEGVFDQTWVAIGPAGAVGAVHRVEGSFTFKLLSDGELRGRYDSLEAAKNALMAALPPGSARPEFREH